MHTVTKEQLQKFINRLEYHQYDDAVTAQNIALKHLACHILYFMDADKDNDDIIKYILTIRHELRMIFSMEIFVLTQIDFCNVLLQDLGVSYSSTVIDIKGE